EDGSVAASPTEESAAANQIPEEEPAEASDESLYALTLVRGIDDFFNSTTHPRQLLSNETFLRCVALTRAGGDTTFSLLANAVGYEALVACMSLEAAARRGGEDDAVVQVEVGAINAYYYSPRFFALRALSAPGRGPAA